jgi:hypothetical protein
VLQLPQPTAVIVQYTGTNQNGVARAIDGVIRRLTAGRVTRAAAASLRPDAVRVNLETVE